jgi:hypothetical protein
MACQNKGGQEFQKKKTPNDTKASCQKPTNFFVCCSIVIKVQ